MEAVDITEHKFTEEQDGLFSELSKKMSFCGIVLIILGVLYLLVGLASLKSGMVGALANLLPAGIYIAMGVWTNRAAASFMLIASSPGHDIKNLMDAIVDLKQLYTIQYICLIVGLILMALVAGLALLAALALTGAGMMH